MSTPLTDVLATYSVLRPITQLAVYNLGRSITLFERFLGHVPTTDDLSDIAASGFVKSLEGVYAQRSIRCNRASLKTIWIFAHRRGLAAPVGDIRKARYPDPNPQVWSLDELRRMLHACVLLDCGEYMHALLLFAYESGLRRSDCWRVRRDQIQPGGQVVLTQHKTKRMHVCQIRPETAAEVLAMEGDPPLAWHRATMTFYRRFAMLRRLANVGDGALQQLRRTGATEVARVDGMAGATAFLGHRSAGMASNYVARSAIAQPHLPPRVA